MNECEQCEYRERRLYDLESRIDELENELRTEQNKTDDYDSIKNDRDELQAAANRRYDNYVTTPEGMP